MDLFVHLLTSLPNFASFHVNTGQANCLGESPASLRKCYWILYNCFIKFALFFLFCFVFVNNLPTNYNWKSLPNNMLVTFVLLWAIARQFSCIFANDRHYSIMKKHKMQVFFVWWKMHFYYSHLVPFSKNFFLVDYIGHALLYDAHLLAEKLAYSPFFK